MNIVPVLFEDHNLTHMRPVAWSTPVFEVRCGMFNTRERVGLCTSVDQGVLLGRDFLRRLHHARGWEWGKASFAKSGRKADRFLWLNGLLAPDFTLIRELITLSETAPEFVWRNDQGLIAALVGADSAAALAEDWDAWDRENSGKGVWADPALTPSPWTGGDLLTGSSPVELAGGGVLLTALGADESDQEWRTRLNELVERQGSAPRWIWDIVGCTRIALSGDLDFVKDGLPFRREPFGIFPQKDLSPPEWTLETNLKIMADRVSKEVGRQLVVHSPEQVFCGQEVDLAPGTAIDASQGPVILDRGVKVMPQCYLEGPLYIGPGSLVKPGTRLHGESSFGMVNRLAGEIGESTFGDFANKQHEGFIGHAVLGSWINLGAMTTCSDLKNNYGEIRVDLGSGAVASGKRFIGLMMGDHAKTAIGVLFNTGTCIGFATNIFGSGMPPKFVGNFLWGGQDGCPAYAVDRAQATAEIVMGRRGCRFTDAHRQLFSFLG